MSEYLNYQKIRDFKEGPIEVICYNRGPFWVCPNPRDSYRSVPLAQQYDRGEFFERKIVRLTEEQFADRSNWNS